MTFLESLCFPFFRFHSLKVVNLWRPFWIMQYARKILFFLLCCRINAGATDATADKKIRTIKTLFFSFTDTLTSFFVSWQDRLKMRKSDMHIFSITHILYGYLLSAFLQSFFWWIQSDNNRPDWAGWCFQVIAFFANVRVKMNLEFSVITSNS